LPAARAYAIGCLDPVCCFGGNNLITALAIAGLILILLAVILALFPELLGVAAVEGTEITAGGLAQVVEHLAQFGEYAPNTMMIERLQAALDAGEVLTGADENFYLHELYEAEMMSQGMGDAAHQAALDFYSHSPFSLYHPDVIQALPEFFNANWLRYWGLIP
jgi:hypothetical protein